MFRGVAQGPHFVFWKGGVGGVWFFFGFLFCFPEFFYTRPTPPPPLGVVFFLPPNPPPFFWFFQGYKQLNLFFSPRGKQNHKPKTPSPVRLGLPPPQNKQTKNKKKNPKPHVAPLTTLFLLGVLFLGSGFVAFGGEQQVSFFGFFFGGGCFLSPHFLSWPPPVNPPKKNKCVLLFVFSWALSGLVWETKTQTISCWVGKWAG